MLVSWRLPAIEHSEHDADVTIYLVVNDVGKSRRKKAMEPESFHMHASLELERIYIREHGIEKVVAYAGGQLGWRRQRAPPHCH